MPVMNIDMYTTSQQEAEGRPAAHALSEHLLQGTGLLVLMDTLLEVRGLRTHFRPTAACSAPSTASASACRRGQHRRPGRRIRLRQERDVALGDGPGAEPARQGRGRGGAVRQSRRAAAVGRRAPQAARRQDVDDLPGADDLAQPGPHVGQQIVEAILAHTAMSPQAAQERARSRCSSWCGSPRPRSASTTIRTTCRAACASA